MNTINVSFQGKESIQISPLWQYDTGQVLKFADLTLPETYEVHFSNHRDSGKAVPVTATSDEVQIPSTVLRDGHTVFAWIYVDGMTTHRITIPIKRRACPEDVELTESEQTSVTALITQMREMVAHVEDLVEQAEGLAVTVDDDGYINIGS